MNVNSVSNSPSFSGVYAYTSGMSRGAKDASYHLMNSIEYSDMVSELDEMGTDIFIVPEKEKNEKFGAKVLFVGRDNIPYKRQISLSKIGFGVGHDRNIKNKKSNVSKVENMMSKIINKTAKKSDTPSEEVNNNWDDAVLSYDDDVLFNEYDVDGINFYA